MKTSATVTRTIFGTFVLLAGLAALSTQCALLDAPPVRRRPNLDAARAAARWLRASGLSGDAGKVWPADPSDHQTVSIDLYSGTAGVVLFFLELHHAAGDPADLEEACAGADALIAGLPDAIDDPEGAGLYTGAAGIGFTLEEVHRASGRPEYREGALRCIRLLHDAARPGGEPAGDPADDAVEHPIAEGAEWGDAADIISGGAGIGLYLLNAARVMDSPEARNLAVRAGRRLVELGRPQGGGLKWAMDPGYPRLMPNFSHGTAGIAYFLARLHEETGDESFLEAALAGGRTLLEISDGRGLVFHHEPGGEDLFYLGWCHGPPGTARLFHQLFMATGDGRWQEAVHRQARAVMASGIPGQQTPGFWYNAGVCCGSAGVASFFLDLHRTFGKEEYLRFAERLTADILARGTRDDDGLRWIHAEHRARPELLAAQTGLMQGAAGIGLFLLHLDALEQGRDPLIVLPDTPFGPRRSGPTHMPVQGDS